MANKITIKRLANKKEDKVIGTVIPLNKEASERMDKIADKKADIIKAKILPKKVKTENKEEPEKNRVGRPLKFETVKELQEKIDDYFKSCFEEEWVDKIKRNKKGEKQYDENQKLVYIHRKELKQIKPITITGLALALDTSRKVLIEYEAKEKFSNTIKRAKDFCENFVEEGLLKGGINPAAGIFNLKNNYNWKEEQKIEHSGSVSLTTLFDEAKGDE